MAALNESQLPVDEHLDIFGSVRGCSLANDAFLAFARDFASMHAFGSLKRLTVSLLLPPKEDHFKEDEDYSDDPTETEVEAQERSTRSATTTCLKECSLRGIYVSESHLLEFLEAFQPATVTLTDVHLLSGTYTSILKYLTGADNPVAYYHLDDTLEENRLVHFDVPGTPKFPYIRGTVGPSSLIRQASHVKEAIGYRFPAGRPVGSGARYRWSWSKAEEFNTPYSVGKFIVLNSPNIAVDPEDEDDNYDSPV